MDSHAVIEFEEYPDEWTRVRISDVSVRDFGAVIAAFNEAARRFMPEPIEKLCELFAPYIDSWSYPEPVDADGLLSRDVNLLLALVREWVTGVRSVPLPLRLRSSDGEPSADPTTSPAT